MDLVTVVVPAFNGAKHLAATLESLVGQDYPDLEVIVVDDGSTDTSADLAEAHPVVSRVVRQSHLGVAVARNRGIAVGRGQWVAFIDQDDLWHPTRVTRLVNLAQSEHSLAASTVERAFAVESDRRALHSGDPGRHDWVDIWIEDGKETALLQQPIPGDLTLTYITVERILSGAAEVTTSTMYDRETAIAAGGCAPHARALDSHVLQLNAARINGGRIPRLDAGDLFYRTHPLSATTTSPMVGPMLSTTAAIRLGGVYDRTQHVGGNLEHLLFGLARSDLSPAEQLALLTLTVPARERPRWVKRWASRRLGVR